VRTNDKPSLTSNEKYAQGIEENRRVELDATDPSLLSPVVHSWFKEYVPVQPRQEFSVSVLNPEQARQWTLGVEHRTKPVARKDGQGVPPRSIVFDLDQEMTSKLGPVVGPVDTLNAALQVNTTAAPANAATRFPLVKTVSNFEVSRLSLIVFDYDRADISKANTEMMRRVVQAAVREGSEASIVGSTDRLGELDHNLQLSTERARAVERTAHAIAPSLTISKVEGIGPSVLPYDNSLPEGRFYCRTVSLTITTPLR
jgi:outer membrane protein OmpA-like peptidoglycan-associated protein